MKYVIDTNVAVTANGRNTHAGYECQERCIELLQDIASSREKRHTVALDSTELILSEYRAHLNYSGQPGVGDVFFKHLHDNMYNRKRVQLVDITPAEDESRSFDELPRNSLDINDRKFLAVALVSRSRLVNALDSDWHQHRDLVSRLGVRLTQLCPEHACPQSDSCSTA